MFYIREDTRHHARGRRYTGGCEGHAVKTRGTMVRRPECDEDDLDNGQRRRDGLRDVRVLNWTDAEERRKGRGSKHTAFACLFLVAFTWTGALLRYASRTGAATSSSNAGRITKMDCSKTIVKSKPERQSLLTMGPKAASAEGRQSEVDAFMATSRAW